MTTMQPTIGPTMQPTIGPSLNPTDSTSNASELSQLITNENLLIGGIICMLLFIMLLCIGFLIYVLIRKQKADKNHTILTQLSTSSPVDTPPTNGPNKTANLFRINSTSASMVIEDDMDKEENVFGTNKNTEMFASVRPENNSKTFQSQPSVLAPNHNPHSNVIDIADDSESENKMSALPVPHNANVSTKTKENEVFGLTQNADMFGIVRPINNSKLFAAPPVPSPPIPPVPPPKNPSEDGNESMDEYYNDDDEEEGEELKAKSKGKRKKRTKKRVDVATQHSMGGWQAPRISAHLTNAKNMQNIAVNSEEKKEEAADSDSGSDHSLYRLQHQFLADEINANEDDQEEMLLGGKGQTDDGGKDENVPLPMPPPIPPPLVVIQPSIPPTIPPAVPPPIPSVPLQMPPSVPPQILPLVPPSVPPTIPPLVPPSVPPSVPPIPPSIPPPIPPSVPPQIPSLPPVPPTIPPSAPPPIPPSVPPPIPQPTD